LQGELGLVLNQWDRCPNQRYKEPGTIRGQLMKKRKSSGRMASKGYPNPIDVHVGARIRLRRTLLGISQTALADAIGLTFQQVQKYEKGTNRVSSSRLVDMANALDVAIPYFFEDMSAGVGAQTPSALMKAGQRPTTIDNETDPFAKRETLEFVRAYYKIQDPAVRKRLAELTKAIAKANGRSSARTPTIS
jgi:transcriptional regulator with XRE-family HTH domain